MPTSINQAALLNWYDRSGRALPWRVRERPSGYDLHHRMYAVWVSEIMCQQTQIATVLPYYQRWMARFPTVHALADADEQDALKLWEGLGYYRRCRLLLDGAREVARKGFPNSAREWMLVPGVGRYTAAAIASICLGEAAPLVDGNVERVFARFAGCEESDHVLHRAAWDWAADNLYAPRSGDWNQALMELGALVCKPRSPLCGSCPVAEGCRAHAMKNPESLPRRSQKRTVEAVQLAAYGIVRERTIALQKIPAGEWWEGMWRLPQGADGEIEFLGSIAHTVTHHRVTLSVFRATTAPEGVDWVKLEDLDDLPLPVPQRRALHLLRSK